MKRVFSSLVLLAMAVSLILGLTACTFSSTAKSWTGKYVYENADRYTAGGGDFTADEVKHLDIDWGAGEVQIYASEDATAVTVREEYVSTDKDAHIPVEEESALYRWLDGDTLRIKFLQSKKTKQSVDAKTLMVTIPAGLTLGEVKVRSDSAGVNMGDMTMEKFDIESVSGNLLVAYCLADTMHLKSVSGEVSCGQGTARTLDAETTSGKIYVEKIENLATLKITTVSGNVRLWHGSTIPGQTEVDTTSGEVKLMFPTGSAFTVVFETTSGTYNLSGFEETVSGNTHHVAGGGAVYDIETVSGNVIVTRITDN
ncbi:MAG: DUF4097 family beta strand repeat-containing protein [Eubacteriales bacterium]